MTTAAAVATTTVTWLAQYWAGPGCTRTTFLATAVEMVSSRCADGTRAAVQPATPTMPSSQSGRVRAARTSTVVSGGTWPGCRVRAAVNPIVMGTTRIR